MILYFLECSICGLLNHSLALCLHYNSPEITVMHIFKKLTVTWKPGNLLQCCVTIIKAVSLTTLWLLWDVLALLVCYWLFVLLYCVFCRVGRGISSAWSTAASCWRHTPSACWWHAHTPLQVLCPSHTNTKSRICKLYWYYTIKHSSIQTE